MLGPAYIHFVRAGGRMAFGAFQLGMTAITQRITSTSPSHATTRCPGSAAVATPVSGQTARSPARSASMWAIR